MLGCFGVLSMNDINNLIYKLRQYHIFKKQIQYICFRSNRIEYITCNGISEFRLVLVLWLSVSLYKTSGALLSNHRTLYQQYTQLHKHIYAQKTKLHVTDGGKCKVIGANILIHTYSQQNNQSTTGIKIIYNLQLQFTIHVHQSEKSFVLITLP